MRKMTHTQFVDFSPTQHSTELAGLLQAERPSAGDLTPTPRRQGEMGWGKVPLSEAISRFQVFPMCGGRETERFFRTWTQSKTPAVQDKRMVCGFRIQLWFLLPTRWAYWWPGPWVSELTVRGVGMGEGQVRKTEWWWLNSIPLTGKFGVHKEDASSMPRYITVSSGGKNSSTQYGTGSNFPLPLRDNTLAGSYLYSFTNR